ncbi:MAG: hypothetical protein ACPGID_11780 [Rubricella sp.]
MSAENTNPKKQARRHIVPIIGILGAAAFGLLMALFMADEAVEEAEPVGIANPEAVGAPSE